MRYFRDSSIKHKLILIVMLASVLALLFASVAFIVYDRVMFKREMVRDLMILAEIIGSNCSAALAFRNENDARETLSGLRAKGHVVAAVIYTKDGQPFASYSRAGANGDFPTPFPEDDAYFFAEDHLVVSKKILLDGKKIGAAFIRADLEELHARLASYAGIVVLVMGISSLAALLVTSRLQRIISGPISDLTTVTRTVSVNKDYSLRAQKHGKDELGFLTERFNEMLVQIQDRDAALQNARDQLEMRADELQRELAERKIVDEQVKASLKEKEVLLKEIHHRVKNNLQIISSLLDLQSGSIRDKQALEIFKDSRNRIKSMALIHEKLYQSRNLSKIDVAEYIQNLIAAVRSSYVNNSGCITIRTNIENIFLNIDTAIPCGLIINELVSNALKYAFPAGGEGNIDVAIQSNNGDAFTMTVHDNGVGLPEEVNIANTETLGLQLVNMLAAQHNAEVEIHRNGGTTFKIKFIVPK